MAFATVCSSASALRGKLTRQHRLTLAARGDRHQPEEPLDNAARLTKLNGHPVEQVRRGRRSAGRIEGCLKQIIIVVELRRLPELKALATFVS